MKLRPILLAPLPILLAACATAPTAQQVAQRTARYEAAAGKPIRSLYLNDRNFYSWEAINDHQVVVYLSPTHAYLLDLPPCPGLMTSNGLAYTVKMDQINVNFDNVIPSQTSIPCQIRNIRPVDAKKVKETGTHADIHGQERPAPAAGGH